MKTKLDFISYDNLFLHVKNTIDSYKFNINFKELNKNILDPIKLTFDSKIYQKTAEELIQDEILRQIDKSNTNHIGYFHQNIFKYINPDWKVQEKGFDIINEKLNIYVEMKNKHNTMNSSSSQKTYMQMLSKIEENSKNVCMLVEIIATKSQNIEWSISLNNNHISKSRIRRVSIDKFYEMVTGDKNAFKKLCEILPSIINDVLEM